ncbi:unnamed protein product [Orchesella dallaii]|uniref:Uncharacterized protein n=1 Tax=Orchesella dallaii TaxID=48710 RepID=A0ABP1Q6I6_9HEXA
MASRGLVACLVPDNATRNRLLNLGITMNKYLTLLELGDNSFYNLKTHSFRRYNFIDWCIHLWGKLNVSKLQLLDYSCRTGPTGAQGGPTDPGRTVQNLLVQAEPIRKAKLFLLQKAERYNSYYF